MSTSEIGPRGSPTAEQVAEWEEILSDTPLPVGFQDLARQEPRLWGLAAQAVRIQSNAPYCANADWYGQLKPVLCELVGWVRKGHPVLGSSSAYDLAYETIYELLPDCSHSEMCWAWNFSGG